MAHADFGYRFELVLENTGHGLPPTLIVPPGGEMCYRPRSMSSIPSEGSSLPKVFEKGDVDVKRSSRLQSELELLEHVEQLLAINQLD